MKLGRANIDIVKNPIPEAISINGYLREIFFWHLLQRPFKKINESRGMLSYHGILLLHLGQKLLPFIKFTPLGTLKLTTETKDPINRPNTNKKI